MKKIEVTIGFKYVDDNDNVVKVESDFTDNGYCYKDFVNGKCSNENCFTCKKLPSPNCVMAQIKSPTNSIDMFCDDCKEIINSHLKDHH